MTNGTTNAQNLPAVTEGLAYTSTGELFSTGIYQIQPMGFDSESNCIKFQYATLANIAGVIMPINKAVTQFKIGDGLEVDNSVSPPVLNVASSILASASLSSANTSTSESIKSD